MCYMYLKSVFINIYVIKNVLHSEHLCRSRVIIEMSDKVKVVL